MKYMSDLILNCECDHCGLMPVEANARRMYVVDHAGKRRICPHPLEYATVEKHLGANVSDQILRERTGHLEEYFCSNCFHAVAIDPDRDSHTCSECAEGTLERGIELANRTCPRCGEGTIVGKPMKTDVIDEIIRSLDCSREASDG